MTDLIAIAFVRRTLMDLGLHIDPDAVRRHADIGPLEMWIHERRPELDDQTPLTVFRTDGGEDRIREALAALVTNAGYDVEGRRRAS